MIEAERLADGRLRIPRAAYSDEIIGDGVDVIGPDDPDYAEWDAWLSAQPPVTKYREDQARDDHGRFADEGGGGGRAGGGGTSPPPPPETPPTHPAFSDIEIGAIQYYTGSDYRPLNSALWRGNPLTPEQQHVVSTLDALTDKDLHEPVDVWRGMRMRRDFADENLKPGAILEHKGFVSTSKDVGQAAYQLARTTGASQEEEKKIPVMLRIRNAIRGFFVGPHSEYPEQQELVMGRGTRFKIDRVGKVKLWSGESRGKRREIEALEVEVSPA